MPSAMLQWNAGAGKKRRKRREREERLALARVPTRGFAAEMEKELWGETDGRRAEWDG